MKNEQWQGLITNASPYAIPPGSSVEQVNAQTNKPGQLSSRKGMAVVPVAEGRVNPVDVQSVNIGENVYLFGTTANGLELFHSPGVLVSDESGLVPNISSTENVTATSYLMHYFANGVEEGSQPVDPTPVDPPTNPEPVLVSGISGGISTTASHEFCFNATEFICETDIDVLDGGLASTTTFTPLIDMDGVCLCESPAVVAQDPVIIEDFDLTDTDGNTIVDHEGNDLNTQPPFNSATADLIETHDDVVITTETESGLFVL